MAIQRWADGIVLADLADEPQFSDDMAALVDQFDSGVKAHVVVNLGGVAQLNSSNLSQLLKLRQRVTDANRHMRLCCLSDRLWSIMLTTGLDKVFEFEPDLPTALAALQLDE